MFVMNINTDTGLIP